MGFFSGIFIATFQASSYALFITHFEESTDLPIAIVISGLLGMVFTYIYSKLQVRISYRYLTIGILLFLFTSIAALAYGFVNFKGYNNLFYIAFVLIVPFSYLLMLIFWGIFGRVFNVGQAKRIIGNIDLGQMLATLGAFFAIAFITDSNFLFDQALLSTEDLIYFSLVAIGGCIFTFYFVTKNYEFSQSEMKLVHEDRKEITIPELGKNRYLFLLSSFIIVSMIVVTFIDFSFANVITARYTDQNALTSFIGFFEGTVIIFSFLLQTLVTDRIIHLYGLRISLLVNPILIVVIITASVAIGVFLGYTPENSYFLFFFIAIAGAKLFIASIKDAIDSPTFKLYFLPIPINLRLDAQSKIEGVVNATAYSIGGILIILISKIQAFNLLYISIFAIPFLILWYVIIQRMYHKYNDALQGALRSGMTEEKQHAENFTVKSILEKSLESNTDQDVLFTLKMMERLEPTLFENTIINLSDNDNKNISEFVQNKLSQIDLDYNVNSETKSLAKAALAGQEQSEVLSIPPNRLLKLSKSVDYQDRVLAVKYLRKLINDDNIFVLLELLRDIDIRVKKEALITARVVNRKETYNTLVEQLSSSYFCQYAADALVSGGQQALEILESSFHRSGQTDEVMRKIVQVIGRIGGQQAIALLWDKIDFPDRKVVRQVLISLRHYNYQASGFEASNIKSILEHEASKTIWNLAAIKELPDEPAYMEVRNALKEEIKDNYDDIFMLLSLLYDPAAVQLVKHNLEKGDSESITYGMELMALFIEPDIKDKLFPLLDDVSVAEKIRKLQDYFPRENYSAFEVITYLMSRNYNLTNRWTKAAAINTLISLPDYKINNELLSQLFNPDILLRQTAGWVIYNKDRESYNSVTNRLLPEEKRALDEAMSQNSLTEGLEDGFFLHFEVCQRLKEMVLFRPLPGVMISEIADNIKMENLERGQEYFIEQNEDSSEILIMALGSATIHYPEGEAILNSGDVIGEITNSEQGKAIDKVKANETTVLFTITNHDFYNIMANQHEMAHILIEHIKENIENINQH